MSARAALATTLATALCTASLLAVQAPSQPSQSAAPAPRKGAATSAALNLTAASANVKEPGSPVKIHLVRWSTDEERTPLLTALNPPPPPPPAAGGDRGAGAAGAAGGRAARGGAAAGRGGRAGGRGGRGGDAAPLSPVAAFTAALAKAPTLGYIWTNDVTGYSVKYAWHAPLPQGGERIVLATDRRLGAYAPGWAVTGAATPTDYEFTVFELHLDPKGAGEGKTSLVSKVVVDNDARTVALENYGAAPAMLQNIKR